MNHGYDYFCQMHELSIAQSIIELVTEEARKAEAAVITLVEVDIGTMAGVEADALLFAWEIVVRDTIAQGAPLQINTIQAEAQCNECGTTFPIGHFFTRCPQCSSYRYQVIKGKELKVSSLLVE